MSTATWSLQDAKNKFSAVDDAARRGTPQTVTRRGKPAVVVLATEDYQQLRHLQDQQAPSFIEHLLALPQSPKGADAWPEHPLLVTPRDVDL
jgi:prevent-host-death family protein